MIYILRGEERNQHRSLFERLFKLRYQVFIADRKWSLPSRDGLETDQYDTPDAVYFFEAGPNGDIRAHVRLTPTVHSSLLADYFPHLVETDADPRGATIYEATRFMILPTQIDKAASRAIKASFMAAVIEWCMGQGISHTQTVIDAGTLPFYTGISLLTTPLGLAHPFGGGKSVPGGGECLAFRWEVGSQLLSDIRAYGALPEPTEPPWRPAAEFAA